MSVGPERSQQAIIAELNAAKQRRAELDERIDELETALTEAIGRDLAARDALTGGTA